MIFFRTITYYQYEFKQSLKKLKSHLQFKQIKNKVP